MPDSAIDPKLADETTLPLAGVRVLDLTLALEPGLHDPLPDLHQAAAHGRIAQVSME